MASKRRYLGWLITAVVLIVATGLFLRFRPRPAQPTIRTAKVTRGTVTASVSGNGVLQAATTVEVKSNVGGTIIQLAVDEGDHVKAGQLIARIDPADSLSNLQQVQADLTSAQAKISQAEQNKELTTRQTAANIRASEQAVETARQRLLQAESQAGVQSTLTDASIQQAEQAVEAARVRLAQATAQAELQPRLTETSIAQARSTLAAAKSAFAQTKNALIPQKLAAAQSAYDQAKANYGYAVKDAARQRELLAKGYVPRSLVDAADQRLDVAKAQLDNADNKLATVKSETQDDLQAAQAKVEQAEATLQTAEANRTLDGLKTQDVAAARAALKQAEATLKTAQANRAQDGLKAQDVSVARAALKQAQANLASVKAGALQERIRRGDIVQAQAQTQRSRAAVQNAQTQLQYTTVVAPSNGVVVKKYVEPGSIVTAGRSSFSGSGSGVTIVDLADITHMVVLVNVDETDIAQIAVGQSVDITVDAYSSQLFSGTVTKIAPEAVSVQNVTSVPVTVAVDLPDARLKPNMNATCDFVTQRKTDVLLVPNEAVKETDAGTTVTVMAQGKQEVRPVKVGIVGNDKTEIISGLKEGDEVITAIIQPTGLKSVQNNRQQRRGPGPF